MSKHPVVIIGSSEMAKPFSALGAITHETIEPKEAAHYLTKYSTEVVASVIFIAESLAEPLLPQIEKIKQLSLPAVLIVPEYGSTKKLGVTRLQNTLTRAIGKAL
jgi:vacuolar-type H+-ATPase subunit F/Vma7